jgi:hypothetical protein
MVCLSEIDHGLAHGFKQVGRGLQVCLWSQARDSFLEETSKEKSGQENLSAFEAFFAE